MQVLIKRQWNDGFKPVQKNKLNVGPWFFFGGEEVKETKKILSIFANSKKWKNETKDQNKSTNTSQVAQHCPRYWLPSKTGGSKTEST